MIIRLYPLLVFPLFFWTTNEVADLVLDLYQAGIISILFGMGREKYHSLVSYRKKSSMITFTLYSPSIVWCHHMLMKGWWYLHAYWEKGWSLNSGPLDTREPSGARWSMTQPTPLTKSQLHKVPYKPNFLGLTARSWCFEKAAEMLTLALWAVLAIWTDSRS